VEIYGTARQTTEDNVIRRMCIAYWITKATDTYSEYVTLISFPLQRWSLESSSVLGYKHSAFLNLRLRVEKPAIDSGDIVSVDQWKRSCGNRD
jgi:hypothetical protein